MELQRSVSMRRVGSPIAPRRLRLRGEPELARQILPPRPGDGGSIMVLTRDPVSAGERVRIEVSLGAMVDEVLLNGMISMIRKTGDDDGAAVVTLRIAVAQAKRLVYLLDVLEGQREASARGSRRTPCDLPVAWERAGRLATTRLQDLSRGGAFIVSDVQPEVGEDVRVRILGQDDTGLEFDARVSWLRPAGSCPGFGVAFRIRSRATATALQALIRAQENAAPVDLSS